MRVLIVLAIAVLSFACGGAPSNNTNRPANLTNISNSNMTNSNLSMPSNSVNASSNAMSNKPSNMSTNSMSNSKANTSTISNTSKSNSAAPTVAGNKKIKGNKASKVYHLPGCPDYDKISAANVVTFDTEQEARAAGYKLAGNCK
jgi:hypothetical protein